MIYLILAIVSSTLIAVLMRILDPYIKNNMVMFTSNYAVCEILSLIFLFADKGLGALSFKENSGRLPFAIILGLISGILYLVSFILLQLNIQKNGIIMASTFMKMGVLVPVLMAIILFKESCSAFQIVGFILALAAIIVINEVSFSKGKEPGRNPNMQDTNGIAPNIKDKISESSTGLKRSAAKRSMLWLLLLLFLSGLTDSTSNIFDKLGNPELKDFFLIFIFLSAILFSIILAFVKKQHFTTKDFLCGIAIGIPNYFSSRFLLYSLSSVPAVIAYPSYNIAVIFLISIIGVLAFRERLNARKILGLALIAGAIAALNF